MKALLKVLVLGGFALVGMTAIAQTATPQTTAAAQNPNVPPWIAEVTRMGDAGVAPEIQEAYVKNTTSFSALSVDDILYLKSHGINDKVITAMILHGAEARQAATVAANQPAPYYPQAQYPAATPVYAATPAQPDYQVPVQYPDTTAPYYYPPAYPSYYDATPYYNYSYNYNPWPVFIGGFGIYSRPFFAFGGHYDRPGFGRPGFGRPGFGGGVRVGGFGGRTVGAVRSSFGSSRGGGGGGFRR